MVLWHRKTFVATFMCVSVLCFIAFYNYKTSNLVRDGRNVGHKLYRGLKNVIPVSIEHEFGDENTNTLHLIDMIINNTVEISFPVRTTQHIVEPRKPQRKESAISAYESIGSTEYIPEEQNKEDIIAGLGYENDTLKMILLWTTQGGKEGPWWGHDELGRQPFFSYNCPENRCTIEKDRSLVDRADMLVFFLDDPPEWPEVRHSHQLYVHSIYEAPSHFYEFLSDYDGKINLTMNYRLDADIVSAYQTYIPHLEKNMRGGVYVPRNALSDKNRSAVWPVSHCNAPSGRDDYVKELSKYIDVDIIGQCGNLTCSGEVWNTCFFSWEKHYRFYLAFENNFCQDYATEKLFSPLTFELIPVVFGMADYQKIAPPHSVIDVRDFKSPKDLAAHLHYLADNPVKYTEYFQWKQSWELEDGYVYREICRLCTAAHDPKFSNKHARQDYKSWFLNDTCDNNIVKKWSLNW